MCDESCNSVPCLGCRDDLPLDHNGIKCLQNHNMCTDCSKGFINMLFAEPQIYLPPKFPDCRTDVLVNTIEMQLDPVDLVKFHDLYLIHTLSQTIDNPNDVIASCPFCNYFEIRDKDGINFVFCQNPTCFKRSCYFCHLELNDDFDRSQVYDEVVDANNTRDHFKCALFNPIKTKIDKAIEDGSKVHCPNCQTAGRKDDACTHMSCVKCNTRYCYICGISEQICNKEPGGISNIYRHNINWERDPLRCPMFMYQINEIDKRWPGQSDMASLDFYHRIKIMRNLKRLLKNEKREEIDYVEEKFGFFKKAGFKIESILSEDLTLIKRAE